MAGLDGDYCKVVARRELDGVTFHINGLDRVLREDLVALHTEQLLLPGKLIEWTVVACPRPWQPETPRANVPARHNPT